MSRTDESLYSQDEADFDDYRSRQPHAVPAPTAETVAPFAEHDPAARPLEPAVAKRKAS
jgi:hypothetical protein